MRKETCRRKWEERKARDGKEEEEKEGEEVGAGNKPVAKAQAGKGMFLARECGSREDGMSSCRVWTRAMHPKKVQLAISSKHLPCSSKRNERKINKETETELEQYHGGSVRKNTSNQAGA